MNTLRNKLSPHLRAALIAVTLLGVGSSVAFDRLAAKRQPSVRPVQLIVDDKPVQRESGTTSFAPVVKKVAPSVVKVFTTSKVVPVADRGLALPNDSFWRRFFGEDAEGPAKPFHAPRQHGLGSGVIVSKDGYILTNNHVVDGADEVKVTLSVDSAEYTAKVIGRDPKTDIAVLKIDANGLPVATLGNSDAIEVGDLVLAVGNPFGIGQTVTMGMVSATGRGNMGIDYEDFIQTDAAINPGNSGGALVDAEGRLIGINTAILSRSGGNQGIGFAVPVNLARNVMESLIKDGRVVRGYLGVTIQDLTGDLAKEFGDGKGVLVSDVNPKSPADKAGLRSGDVITEFNGKTITDSRHLKLQVAQVAPGAKTPVTILRDGKTRKVEVVLQEVPGSEKLAKNQPDAAAPSDALDGVEVGDVDGPARRQLRLPAGVKGALVTKVEEESPAFEAGLREGDVIQEIDRRPVGNAEEAVRLSEDLKDKKDHKILLRVWSKGGSRYLVVNESKVS